MGDEKIPDEIANYGVIMGTRTNIRGKGVCISTKLELGEMVIVDEFLPLDLGYVDDILEMQLWESQRLISKL